MKIRKKIKICHVTSAHSRYDGRIFLKQCTSLATAGYSVVLLCCDTLSNEEKHGVSIVSTGKKFKSVYDRLLNSKKILKKMCIEIDADVYEFHDPDLLDLALCMKKYGKKVIFDSHEDYPMLFLEREWIPSFLRKPLSRLYVNKETRIFKKIDGIICVADYQFERISKINKNVSVITNYPILEKIEKFKEKNNSITKLCFAGGVRSDWNHDVVIRAIADIDNINYIVAGNYNDDYVSSLKTIPGTKKVEFLGKLPYDRVKDLYYNSNIGMALCSYRPNTGYKKGSLGITKIFEYMMYGLPVIFTDFEIFTNILKEGRFGIAVNPYSDKEVNAAIKYLMANPKEAILMGKTGRKLIETKYNWATQIPILLSMYESVIGYDR